MISVPGFGRTRKWRIGACIVIALVPLVAQAYINGGDRRHNFEQQKAAVQADGWYSVYTGAFPGEVALGMTFFPDPEPRPNFQRFVKQLVARAIAELPYDEQARFTKEYRDQLVTLAEEWLAAAKQKRPVQPVVYDIGPFRCKFGVTDFSTWWETNYKGEGRKIHAKRTYDFFYIAIKPAGSSHIVAPADALKPVNGANVSGY